MSEVNRVFFHELGHFVARELNLNYFQGTGTEQISIYRCPENYNLYCGKTTPIRPINLPKNANPHVPLDRLAEHLASDVYGCIFQAYFQNNNFNDCFDYRGNGLTDIQSWYGSIMVNNLLDIRSDLLKLYEEYFSSLKVNSSLDCFIAIQPGNLLTETKNQSYQVNLIELRELIQKRIIDHSAEYISFVNGHQAIINQNIN